LACEVTTFPTSVSLVPSPLSAEAADATFRRVVIVAALPIVSFINPVVVVVVVVASCAEFVPHRPAARTPTCCCCSRNARRTSVAEATRVASIVGTERNVQCPGRVRGSGSSLSRGRVCEWRVQLVGWAQKLRKPFSER
jgi:hypothetical protein